VRLFVAIDLEDAARKAIAAAQERLTKALDIDRNLKWITPSRIHLTLAFLGEIQDDAVAGLVEPLSADLRTPPFDAEFDGLGVFPPRGAPRVLWLGVGEGAREIVEVQREIAHRLANLGVELERRPFHPHLTLGRWRRSRAADARRAVAADRQTTRARTRIDHVTLYRSRLATGGPTYTPLARATLT
jgi:2'-5' RNA ligase